MMHFKHYCLLVLVCLYSLRLFAQDKNITVGRIITVHSKILNQDRLIMMYLPPSYDKAKKYPVIYLLDGKQHTVFTGALVDRLAEAGVVPEMIVVGIPNIDRTKDLTPTHTLTDEKGGTTESQNTSGGGNNFVDFIEKELFTYIESHYSTMPYRIFIGHSYGGLLVTHTLFSERNLFNAYISIDPSLFWDNYYLINKVKNGDTFHFNNNILYTASIIDHKNPDDPMNNGVGISKLAAVLKEKPVTGLDYTFENFENDNHGSVPPISINKGIRYIFRDYYLPGMYVDSIARNSQKIMDHFKAFSDKVGIKFLPPEALIDNLGYYVLEELHDVDKAIEIFKLNTTNYPESSKALDSLAWAYLKKGDVMSANETMKKKK
jgi:predicted alpha/beta superfamily hydrolase